MKIRQYLESNPQVATGVAAGVLVIAALLIFLRLKAPGAVGIYFYDLNSKQLIVADSETLSPYDAGNGTYDYEDGPAGSAVQAGIYSCDPGVKLSSGMTIDEIKEAGAELVWLRRYASDALPGVTRLKAGEKLDEATYHRTMALPILMSDPTGERWFPETGPGGVELLSKGGELCGGAQPVFVTP